MTSTNKELELADKYINETGCNIYLTGKAGTGKTTFLQNLRKDCSKRLVVTAPTGVAAINANGVTLHSFFQLPFGPFVPGSERSSSSYFRFSKEKTNIIRSLDLLIIDEISMVRSDLLDAVDYTLRRIRNRSAPFAGVQLLMIGDLYQLPPVVKDGDWRVLQPHYSSPYFFSSHSLQQTEMITVELQKVYRQEDEKFISLLNKVRNNRLDPEAKDTLNKRYLPNFQPNEKDEYITLCTHNRNADSINETRLNSLNSRSYHFKATTEGDFPDHSYPTADKLALKHGAQVMFIKNDTSQDKQYYNGKIGRITSINNNEIRVKGLEDNHEITVEKAVWENIEYNLNPKTEEIEENKIGEFRQHPLRLAWGITIHKSQGLTFDRAIIDAQSAFAHGQVYVALSRCRTLDGLVLTTPLAPKGIKVDHAILGFLGEQQKTPPSDDHLNSAKISYEQKLITECFDFQKLQSLLNRFTSIIVNNQSILHISGISDVEELKKKTNLEICSVGPNFINQLHGLFSNSSLPSSDATIKERLHKASNYFTEKFTEGIGDQIEEFGFDTDNKEVRKRVRNSYKLLLEELRKKESGIASCKDGFSPQKYFRAISSATLKKDPVKTKTVVEYNQDNLEFPKLFSRLKKWRSAKAKAENIAHFQVMHQKCLVQIAATLPTSEHALLQVRGIGPALASRYGDELLEIVSQYIQEENLTRYISEKQQPTQHLLIKKSTYEITYDLFKTGLSIDEIAKERSLTKNTVEKHLASFVSQGKLDVSLFISTDACMEVIAKHKELQTPSLKAVKEALDNRYTYSDITFCLAHLKSLSSDK